jgi:hypothetical protein
MVCKQDSELLRLIGSKENIGMSDVQDEITEEAVET